MKNNIRIMSRSDAESLVKSGFPENTAVISFCDPMPKPGAERSEPIDYRGVCSRAFRVEIHDVDIEVLSDFGLDFDSYFPEAMCLARFISDCVDDGFDIICQCEYGQSRSAACAAAIKEFYDKDGISVFADYRYYPNQLVFNKLLEALKNNKELNGGNNNEQCI